MNDEIGKLSQALATNEFMRILRAMGHDVIHVPVREKTTDGRIFVWHKPFIDDSEALKALNKFKGGE